MQKVYYSGISLHGKSCVAARTRVTKLPGKRVAKLTSLFELHGHSNCLC